MLLAPPAGDLPVRGGAACDVCLSHPASVTRSAAARAAKPVAHGHGRPQEPACVVVHETNTRHVACSDRGFRMDRI